MPRGTPGSSTGETIPAGLPQGTPGSVGGFDHSFTLQAVMQMQKDLGVLGEKIDRMREDLGDLKSDGKDTRDKVHGVDKSIAKFKGAIVVVGAVYTAAIAILGILLTAYLRTPSASQAGVSADTAAQPTAEQKNEAAEAAPTRRR